MVDEIDKLNHVIEKLTFVAASITAMEENQAISISGLTTTLNGVIKELNEISSALTFLLKKTA